jgi:hypothetical protein
MCVPVTQRPRWLRMHMLHVAIPQMTSRPLVNIGEASTSPQLQADAMLSCGVSVLLGAQRNVSVQLFAVQDHVSPSDGASASNGGRRGHSEDERLQGRAVDGKDAARYVPHWPDDARRSAVRCQRAHQLLCLFM